LAARPHTRSNLSVCVRIGAFSQVQIEEVVSLKPDIIMAGTMAGVIAAKKLTDTIPIVCANLTNPIEFCVAASHEQREHNNPKCS
jgi:hypothetical protein